MKIPVFCFNEHHEAFYYWHRARIEGLIKFPLDLIHVDAHPDMAQPTDFRQSIYPGTSDSQEQLDHYRHFSADHLTIADFILPAVLTGLIKNVHFVYPAWRKFKPSRKKLSICSAFGEGKVLKYGIRIKKNDSPLMKKAVPDLVSYRYVTGTLQNLNVKRPAILDIDLDYFACCDSISNHFSYEIEITRTQFEQREHFFSDPTLVYSGFDIEFQQRQDRYWALLRHKKTPEVSHIPSEAEIEREIEVLVASLMEKKIRPSLITICRSFDSGYCPRDIGTIIEPILLQKLEPLL